MNTQEEGIQAFELHQLIVENERQRRILLGKNIANLKLMKDSLLFKVILGDNEAEWSAYLGQVETFYSRNEVYNLIRIYNKFVVELGCDFSNICDIPISRLSELVLVVDKHNLEDLLANARVLTSQDFRNSIRGIKGLATIDDGHPHLFVDYKICSVCGERHKKENHYEENKQ